MPTVRNTWRATIGALAVLIAAGHASAASAAPVTIDFESGPSPFQHVSSDYGPPGVPGGITFGKGIDFGFAEGSQPGLSGMHCDTPIVWTSDPAHSGTRSINLQNCGSGENYHPSAATFKVDWPTDSIDFFVGVPGGTPSSCVGGICAEIVTTGFDANRNVVAQEDTALGVNTSYKEVPLLSGSNNIAFVTIEEGTKTGSDSPTGVTLTSETTGLLVDDLTYDKPAAPPESSFVLGASPNHATLTPGGVSVGLSIPVTWFGNASPPAASFAFSVPGDASAIVPSGMHGSFSSITPSGATLTLSADTGAPPATQKVKIDAYVDKGQPGEKHASETIPVTVQAPYQVTPPGAWSLAPCTPQTIGLRVATAADFTQPLTLKVNTQAQPAVRITGISGGQVLDPSHATTVVTPQSGVATATLDVTVAPGADPAAPADFSVLASAQGYFSDLATGTLAVNAGDITGVFRAGTRIPVQNMVGPLIPGGFLRPPTKIDVTGHGFCPGSGVEFGAVGGDATPTVIAQDGESLSVTVPREAVDGPIRVVPGGGSQYVGPKLQVGADIVGPSLRVDNFRARYSLAFQNKGAPDNFSYRQFEQVFGYDAMHFKIDLCEGLSLGLGHCPATTPMPDPIAAMIKVALEGRGKLGLCYGFSRTVGQFAFDGDLGGFPPVDARFPNDLTAPPWDAAPPGGLLDRIEINHIQQWDANLIAARAGLIVNNWGASPAVRAAKLRAYIAAQLTAKPLAVGGGQPAIVDIAADGAGHAVLAYDIEDLGGGNYKIDVLDPNRPFTQKEAASGSHADTQDASAIVVDPAANRWTFANLTQKDGTPWHGEIDGHSLNPQPLPPTYDQQPKLPGLGDVPNLIVLASDGTALGQVTDASGRQLIGPDGETQSGSAAIPGAAALPPTDAADGSNPIGVLPRDGTYTISGRRSGAGGRLTAVAPGFVAAATTGHSGAAADASSVDRLLVDQRAGSAALTPGVGGPITLTITTRTTDGATRAVALAGAGSARTSDAIRLLAGGGLGITHRGAPATRTITLSVTSPGGPPATVDVRVRLLRDRPITLQPDWRHLSAGVAAIGLRTGVRLLRPRTRPGLLGPLVLRIRTRRGAASTITARLMTRRREPLLTGGVTFLFVQGRRIVARQTMPLTAAGLRSGRASMSWNVRVPRGVSRLFVAASVATAGTAGVPISDLRVAERTIRSL